MKYLASNDNIEHSADEISLICEVGCNFQINSQNREFLASVMEYVKTLPNDEDFMVELGESFVTLVHKYVSEYSQNETK